MRFKGKYWFLSNMSPGLVEYQGIRYSTTEHFYQAMKTTDLVARKRIAALPSGYDAKREGRRLKVRDDWDEIKLKVMEYALRQKFKDPNRMKMLKSITEEIVEDNTWGDVFWGRCNGRGENHLGRLLMKIRDE